MFSFEFDPMLLAVTKNLSLSWAYVDTNLHYQKVSPEYAASLKHLEKDIEGKSIVDVLGRGGVES